MNFKSKQFIFSMLIGVIVGLLFSILAQPMCWGMIAGVFVAAYFAKVSSPKDGAIVGAIIVMPISVYASFLSAVLSKNGILGAVLVSFVMVILTTGVGSLVGFIIGKLFQVTRGKGIIF